MHQSLRRLLCGIAGSVGTDPALEAGPFGCVASAGWVWPALLRSSRVAPSRTHRAFNRHDLLRLVQLAHASGARAVTTSYTTLLDSALADSSSAWLDCVEGGQSPHPTRHLGPVGLEFSGRVAGRHRGWGLGPAKRKPHSAEVGRELGGVVGLHERARHAMDIRPMTPWSQVTTLTWRPTVGLESHGGLHVASNGAGRHKT